MEHTPQIRDEMAERFVEVYRNTGGCRRRIGDDGYVRLYLPAHPFADQQGELLEHRAAVEQSLGRFLYPCEEVHHKNRMRQDNSLRNLEVLLSRKAHMALHSLAYSPEHIDLVRKAAADPKVRIADLPFAAGTVRRICKEHGIPWVAADEVQLEEDSVREAIQNLGLDGAAAHLGCSTGTIRRRFPHLLLNKRRRPGFLDQHKAHVLRLVEKEGTAAAAAHYQTSITTLHKALDRWGTGKEYARKPPCFLDEHRVEVCELLLAGVPAGKVARRFETSGTTLEVSIRRWSEDGVLPNELAAQLNARPNRKHALRGMDEHGDATPK